MRVNASQCGISLARAGSSHGVRAGRARLRIAVGVRRAISALQPDLMRQLTFRPIDEEFRIECDATLALGVELDHPAVEPALVQLRIDRAIKGVGEIDASAVTTDFHHLRAAAEVAVLGRRMPGARNDAADPDLAGKLGTERVGYIVLLKIAGAPAG